MIRTHPGLVLIPLLAGFAQAGSTPDVSTRAVVAAAGAYVQAYQLQLTSVVAEETYTQEIAARIPADLEGPRTRRMEGEVFFMFAPGGGWMTIRDVMRLDGTRVETRLNVPQVLRDRSVHQAAEAFKTHNARYNLGRTYRNFNEPTLALLVLDAEHRERFSFDRRSVERTSEGAVVVLSFRERDRPTLIRDLKHGPVYARGELRIEAGTGRVLRTLLTAQAGNIHLELTTEYEWEKRLEMSVPVRFSERYESGRRPKGQAPMRDARSSAEYEEVICDATYTNYRRFETQTRVK